MKHTATEAEKKAILDAVFTPLESEPPVRSSDLLDARNKERELCKRDVCMYCGGRALGYKRTPDGPNEAGNWTHLYTTTHQSRGRVLCVASSIFARESFERTQASNAPSSATRPTGGAS